jgi:hypothetical protein
VFSGFNVRRQGGKAAEMNHQPENAGVQSAKFRKFSANSVYHFGAFLSSYGTGYIRLFQGKSER